MNLLYLAVGCSSSSEVSADLLVLAIVLDLVDLDLLADLVFVLDIVFFLGAYTHILKPKCRNAVLSGGHPFYTIRQSPGTARGTPEGRGHLSLHL